MFGLSIGALIGIAVAVLLVLGVGLLLVVGIVVLIARAVRKKPEPAPVAPVAMVPAFDPYADVDPRKMQVIANLVRRHNANELEAETVAMMRAAAAVAAKPTATAA